MIDPQASDGDACGPSGIALRTSLTPRDNPQRGDKHGGVRHSGDKHLE